MASPDWWAKGLLFENCSCHLLCPAHVSFKQRCDSDECVGHWAVHIGEGRFDALAIDGLNVAVLFESPVVMSEGNWRQRLYIDERADGPQREALESIFSGIAGGPWEILGQFVSTRLATSFAPVHFEETAMVKRMAVPGVFDTTVKAIRGRDNQLAVLSNLFNVIHGVVHILSRGSTQCHDDTFDFTTEETHGLYSDFSWTGPSRGNTGERRRSDTPQE